MNHVKRKKPSISKDWWKFQAMNSKDLGFLLSHAAGRTLEWGNKGIYMTNPEIS